MKKTLALFSVMAVAIAGLGVAVFSDAQEAKVTATAQFESISISVSDGHVDYGNLQAGEVKNTMTLNDTQTVKNNGTVATDIFIRGQNSQNWTISFNQGFDEYVHAFSTNSGGSFTSFRTDNVMLAQSVSPGQIRNFDLQIKGPTGSSSGNQQDVSAILTATASSN